MEINKKEIQYFFFSQYIADGIRITLAIVLPVFFFSMFDETTIGYRFALGALAVSISDLPGPVDQKRNGMLYTLGFIFIMALLTGFVTGNILWTGILITAASFFFSMFTIYGNRAASVGTAALLVMIIRLSIVAPPSQVFMESVYILSGGVWYFILALLFYRLTPYLPAQRGLGNCIHEMAKYLRIKAMFYEPASDFEKDYHLLVAQQITVNEKQDLLRELLYNNREIVEESTKRGKLLILTFAEVMELYEQMTATWYDYSQLREKFAHTGILEEISRIINNVADEMDNAGLSIQANAAGKRRFDLEKNFLELKKKVDALGENDPNNLVLKKILVNLRNISRQVDDLFNFFSAQQFNKRKLQEGNYYASFVSRQQVDPSLFFNNLHLESAVFRHSIRMMATCLAGFAIAKFISKGHHSYWILLTIIIILKPGFGLTKERNIQRLLGTIGGGIIGLLILAFINNHHILYGLIIFFMLATYTFQRYNYIIMVFCLTPYIIILFHLLGMPFWDIAKERMSDTAIGGVLAFFSSYLLFPNWESVQLKSYMEKVLKANLEYLKKIRLIVSAYPVTMLEYKLARKELYVSIANLSAAFHRMMSDPKSKQKHSKIIDQFVVLNHVLSSNVAGLSPAKENKLLAYPKEITRKLKRSADIMEETIRLLDKDYTPADKLQANDTVAIQQPDDYEHLNSQLDFIIKVATDINKTTKQIVGTTL